MTTTSPDPATLSGPVADPRDGAAHSRRDAIVAQARDLFLSRGYAAISMQQIADGVGINKATLYHHFRDKDDLFLAVIDREMTWATEQIRVAIARGTTIREQLEHVARAFLEISQCDFRILFHSLKSEVEAERRDAFFASRDFWWDQLSPIFRRAMERGEIQPAEPELYIELFLSMTHSQAPGSIRTRPILPPEVAAPLVVSVFLNGIGQSALAAGAPTQQAEHALDGPVSGRC